MTKVYVIDELVARPGEAQGLLQDYLERYAPGARARGMALDRVLVSPPLWLADGSNTLTITWTLAGVSQWWQMRAQAGAEPAVAAWWAAVDERVMSRQRRFMAAPEDVEGLIDV